MPDQDDICVRQALREGLHAVPTPAISPDFDERVLAGLRSRDAWWRESVANLRVAACSAAVAAVCAVWVAQMPAVHVPGLGDGKPATTWTVPGASLQDLASLIDEPDLPRGSIWWAARARAARLTAPVRPAPGRSDRSEVTDPASCQGTKRSSRWHASEFALC